MSNHVTSPEAVGRIMKQLAVLMVLSIPEPCAPLLDTERLPLSAAFKRPRWNSMRPGLFLSLDWHGTLKRVGRTSLWPIMRRSAG